MLKLSELDDVSKPCTWHFFKRSGLLPDEVHERVRRKKPDDGEDRY